MFAGRTRNLDKILNSLTAISLANLSVDLTGREQNDRNFCSVMSVPDINLQAIRFTSLLVSVKFLLGW